MQIDAIKLHYPDNEDDTQFITKKIILLSELMTPSAIFYKPSKDLHLMTQVRKGQSVSGWHSAAGLSGLGENNQRHTRPEEGTGGRGGKILTDNSAPLKHAKNVVRLETSTHNRLTALTRRHEDIVSMTGPTRPTRRFLQWAWPAPLHCSRWRAWTLSPAINKQGRLQQPLASVWLVFQLCHLPVGPNSYCA